MLGRGGHGVNIQLLEAIGLLHKVQSFKLTSIPLFCQSKAIHSHKFKRGFVVKFLKIIGYVSEVRVILLLIDKEKTFVIVLP